jgi:hypothetical protein
MHHRQNHLESSPQVRGEDIYSVGMEIDPISDMFCFLVCRIPDDEQSKKNSNAEYYTPSSEPFRI